MDKSIGFSQATKKDQDQVLKLQAQHQLNASLLENEEYRTFIQFQGFLVGDYSLDNFQNDYQNHFILAKHQKSLAGYIRIDKQPNFQDNDRKIWYQENLKKQYYNRKHAEIGALVINQQFQRQGIASQLLEKLVSLLKNEDYKHLYSIVTISPIFNFPSLRFHEKHGFQRLAMSYPTTLFGFKDYQSLLYKKDL